jgi:hypothetical protein
MAVDRFIMGAAVAEATRYNEWEEFEEEVARESGTRRVARPISEPEHEADRRSQRPTVPVPGAPAMVSYAASEVRIEESTGLFGREPMTTADSQPMRRAGTLRLRLTPYAREHAKDDGDTEDTPGAMLEYLRRLGPLEQVPHVVAAIQTILVARLDHREGFILSLVDGRMDIDALLDASPMPTHRTLRILQSLRARGLVALRKPGEASASS